MEAELRALKAQAATPATPRRNAGASWRGFYLRLRAIHAPMFSLLFQSRFRTVGEHLPRLATSVRAGRNCQSQ